MHPQTQVHLPAQEAAIPIPVIPVQEAAAPTVQVQEAPVPTVAQEVPAAVQKAQAAVLLTIALQVQQL